MPRDLSQSGDKLRYRILDAFTKTNSRVSVTVVLLGFLMGTILIIIVGRNPLGMIEGIIQSVTGFSVHRRTGALVWNQRHIGEWITSSMPLILCGLSMGFAARTGLFNIGAEGQYVAGITAAQFAAFYLPQVPGLHAISAVLAATLAGALWGGIVGYFKARFKVSEVVATIMMNYIALFLSRILTSRIPGTSTFRTPDFPATVRLSSGWIESLTNYSRLNHGIWFVILALLFYWLIMEKTNLGFSLRATGFNREAARYGGINVQANITSAMAIAGAFAGLAGAVVVLGSFTHGRVLSGQDGFGFDGIAVALVGNSSALGITLAGLLFGMLRSAQPLMESRQIPREITVIIMGLIVVFIALRAGVKLLAEWQMKERARKDQAQGSAQITSDPPPPQRAEPPPGATHD
ncbi:MAG: ABC transporter permease [Treponema sp.]|nr:ABC transporter permease [Treponema sp.]